MNRNLWRRAVRRLTTKRLRFSPTIPIVIMCREILVSGLREFLAELNVKIHVTQLTKWKTTLQMLALGVLVVGPAGEKLVPGVLALGTALLWVAALLTLWTGYGYLKAAVRHAIDSP